jgi:hypothetical protein
MTGFEPTTFRSQSERATKLRHIPLPRQLTVRSYHMRRTPVATVAIAAMATLVLACGSTGGGSSTSAGDSTPAAGAPTKTAPVTVPAGQPMTLTEDLLGTKSVVVVTLTNVKPNVKSGNQFVKPAKGQFVSADVTAVVRDGKVSINGSLFKLVAADGAAYDTATMFDQQGISGSDLTAGQNVSGTIVFDIPVGAQKGAKIALKSWLADGDAGYWQLP